MIDQRWKLDELSPGEKLDRRVQRRMRDIARSRARARQAAPFLPLERVVYALVVAIYVLYAGARTIHVFQETLASHPAPSSGDQGAARG